MKIVKHYLSYTEFESILLWSDVTATTTYLALTNKSQKWSHLFGFLGQVSTSFLFSPLKIFCILCEQ
jgi:hypothetical protein